MRISENYISVTSRRRAGHQPGFAKMLAEQMFVVFVPSGNFITIHDLLHTKTFGGRAWSGAVLRLAMLRTHYHQPIDWTVKALDEAHRTLLKWSQAAKSVKQEGLAQDVLDALLDDLNTPKAIAALHQTAEKSPHLLAGSMALLGLEMVEEAPPLETDGEIKFLISLRNIARKERNFAEADRLRDVLASMNVALRDIKKDDGTVRTEWSRL